MGTGRRKNKYLYGAYPSLIYIHQEQVELVKQTILEKGPNAVKPIEVRVHEGQALLELEFWV